ncbi:MAG: hypothetical protein ACD_76C00029G0004 [uncultured bacterium]|nr:MAG: hypothetical protein ACD_76C00029G0004 [uncultured bacterium]HBD05239.1 hypothetical protein [Candidatus Uhrbacteria bacterium]
MKGFVLNGKLYAFDELIDASAIAMRHVRSAVSRIVTFFALIIFAIVFVSFVYWVYQSGAETIFSKAFWFYPNTRAAHAFVIVIFACYIIYRAQKHAFVSIPVSKKSIDFTEPEISDFSYTQSESYKSKVDISKSFKLSAFHVFEQAFKIASHLDNSEVKPMHIFAATLPSNEIMTIFFRLGIKYNEIQEQISKRLGKIASGSGTIFSDQAIEVALSSYINAASHNRPYVSVIEVFIESYKKDEFLKELLFDKGVDEEKLENVAAWIRVREQLRERYEKGRGRAMLKPTGAMNRAYTAVATPFLDSVSVDMTATAVRGQLPLLVGREKAVSEIFRIIEGGNQSVILVGNSGVGKDAIIEGIAELMAEESVPKILQDKRLVKISIPHLIAGAQSGQVEERILRTMYDVARSGNIVLAVDDLDQLPPEAHGALSSELAKGYTFMIATSELRAYASKIEQGVLGREFIKINIEEPEKNEAIRILESKIGYIEYKHSVFFSFDALEKCVTLADRYVHEKYLPEKAIELAKEAALLASKRGKKAFVLTTDVEKIVAEKTGIPQSQIGTDEREKLLNLEAEIHKRVIGQDEAIKAVSSALRRARTALKSKNRPIGTFLFLGPTGVGKTELAKATASVYFGSDDAMIRFDMSEYQEKGSVYRILGGPGQEGLLTEAVRRKPFSLLLLDELEKAHPDILNLFLQVMDDGRLTDAQGRTVDFTNVILIATSNAGTEFIQQSVKSNIPIEQIKERLLDEGLKRVYRPEFLNRFDGIVVFKPLSEEEVVQIAYLMIAKLSSDLEETRGIRLVAEDEAVYELAKKGYDPVFGARPLRRVIQEEVNNSIATILLQGGASRRDTIVLGNGGEIRVEKAQKL